MGGTAVGMTPSVGIMSTECAIQCASNSDPTVQLDSLTETL